MMKNRIRSAKLAAMSLTGLVVAMGGCLPDNFWADRWAALLISGMEVGIRFLSIPLSIIPAGGPLSIILP